MALGSAASHGAQLIRFAAVGSVCFVLSLAVLAGLHELLGLHYLLAYVVSFIVTSTLGYLLNGRFTFHANSMSSTGVVRYMLVNILLLIINGVALRALVGSFHMWYFGACILLAAINTPVSFLAQRLVTYRLGLGLVGAVAGE